MLYFLRIHNDCSIGRYIEKFTSVFRGTKMWIILTKLFGLNNSNWISYTQINFKFNHMFMRLYWNPWFEKNSSNDDLLLEESVIKIIRRILIYKNNDYFILNMGFNQSYKAKIKKIQIDNNTKCWNIELKNIEIIYKLDRTPRLPYTMYDDDDDVHLYKNYNERCYKIYSLYASI
jgi:hypothetical protein